MKSESNSSMLLLVSVVCLSAAAFLVFEIPDLLVQNTHKSKSSSSIIDKSIASINKVLAIAPHYDFFSYTSGFDSPFRKHGTFQPQTEVKQYAKKNIPIRPKLILKGVLLKDKSLAIIEDESGQTFIRGIGESVLEQQIISINTQKVVFRDRKGTYELAVQEN